MNALLKSLFVLFLLVFAGHPAMAQSGDGDKSDNKAAEKTSEKVSETELWHLRCDKAEEEAEKQCEMFQRLVLVENKKPLAEFVIGFPKDKKDKNSARGVIVLPLGIMLEAGVKIKIDDGKTLFSRMRYCTMEGCMAIINLNAETLDMLKKGNEITFTFQTMQEQDIPVKMSLKGFTKTLKKIL